MRTVKLNLANRSYDIVVGKGAIKLTGKLIRKLAIGNDAYIITNSAIKNKFGTCLEKTLKKSGFSVRFKVVPDTEHSKSIEVLAGVLKDLALYDKKKRLFIVAFGGGVVGDLSGFVASIYKRGVPYVQIPTTILAQVDSAIGGKTAVDLAVGKNLVGAFYQPKLVLSDVNLLKTLPARQIRAGLAEVIKYALIKDAGLLAYLEKNHKSILALKTTTLEHIVGRCSRIKADIVSADEREEKGLRTILNFGHTAGHAIEAASNYKNYNHGEAIALGMLVAGDISKRLGLLNELTYQRIRGVIKKFGLPEKIRKLSPEKIVRAHYRDKKFIGEINRFVLVEKAGKTKIAQNIPLGIIKEAIKNRF